MILPVGARASVRRCAGAPSVPCTLKKLIDSKGLADAGGRRGGFAPDLKSNEEAPDADAGDRRPADKPGEQIALGLDFAASEF